MRIERVDRILLFSFWITSFRFELTRKRSAEKGGRKKKYLPINQKRGLEQERVKNIEQFRRSFLFHRRVSKWNFPSANPFSSLFPDPIPKYRKCIAIGFKTSQLSIDIQHLGNRSSMKFPLSLSLPSKKRKISRSADARYIFMGVRVRFAPFFFALRINPGSCGVRITDGKSKWEREREVNNSVRKH